MGGSGVSAESQAKLKEILALIRRNGLNKADEVIAEIAEIVGGAAPQSKPTGETRMDRGGFDRGIPEGPTNVEE